MNLPTERHLSDISKDKFNYKNLSKNLLDGVLLKMELPNTFGLYGNWGSGKSTMLHFIMSHLSKKSDYHDVAVVYFESWHYEYSEGKNLLYAMLNSIKRDLKIDKKNKIWKKVLKNSLAIGSSLLRNLSDLDIRSVVDDFEFLESKIYKDHELWLDTVKEFKADFQKAIEGGLKKANASKLFIIIDDLDRCLPENAVKLLEGIKNFLSVENTLFLLAIDKRVMSGMIEKKYGLHHGYGDEYMMKIIHYYYHLPKVELQSLTEEILHTYGIEITDRQKAYINNFLKQFSSEPRKAKYCLHQYCMNLLISSEARKSIDDDNGEIQAQYLFVATFLLMRYSHLFSGAEAFDRLRNLRDGISFMKQNTATKYSGVTEIDTSIKPEERKSLESILKNPILSPNQSEKPTVMDVTKLHQALQKIST